MVRLIIDRFEGDFAVCEGPNREIVEIERARLPEGAGEGAVLIEEDQGELRLDQAAAEERRRRIRERQQRLLEHKEPLI